MIKPPDHTWKSYAEFLLSTLPRYEQEWFKSRFDHFFWWWETVGGTIRGKVSRADVPDEDDPKLEAAHKAPSWRRIARCIITNDKLGRSLSFAQTARQWERYQEFRNVYGE
jgi:predicted phosphoadenosine phosphosulfate sulfurtransferase